MGRRGRETERLRERGMERGEKWQEAVENTACRQAGCMTYYPIYL